MKDSMRGLFFIVKGQYRKKAPSFKNKVTEDTTYIGGYDPSDNDTEEWYMLLDNTTYHCICCGRELDRVLKGVYRTIKDHKGDAKHYFKHVCTITSEDYYETHYLGRRPLTDKERSKKAEGRCPRVSPAMKDLYGHVFSEYGDYYIEEIEEMEDLAYKELKENTPFHKARKLVKKTPKKEVDTTPVKKEVLEETPKTLKKVNKKPKLGVKKLPME